MKRNSEKFILTEELEWGRFRSWCFPSVFRLRQSNYDGEGEI